MQHQAQGFDQAVIPNAYAIEEEAFKKTIRQFLLIEVANDASIIKSNNIYKVKMNDDKTWKLKARIAPHGNEDSIKDILKSDSCTTEERL